MSIGIFVPFAPRYACIEAANTEIFVIRLLLVLLPTFNQVPCTVIGIIYMAVVARPTAWALFCKVTCICTNSLGTIFLPPRVCILRSPTVLIILSNIRWFALIVCTYLYRALSTLSCR